MPSNKVTPAEVAAAAAKADRNPSAAQKESGNYAKGHIRLHGMDVTIENAKGSVRSGVSKSGVRWRTRMAAHYGYIVRAADKKPIGADGDHVDVFIGPDPSSWMAYIVDQVNPDGSFDENKVMLGYRDKAAAEAGYLANYGKGWKGMGRITALPIPAFKRWLRDGGAKAPAGLNKAASALPAVVTRAAPAGVEFEALGAKYAAVAAGRGRWYVAGAGSAGYIDAVTPSGLVKAACGVEKPTITVYFRDTSGHVKAAAELEHACTPELASKGLSGRKEIPGGTGMFFDKAAAFWMRGCLAPLDLLYVAEDGTVTEKIAMPLDAAGERAIYSPSLPAESAIELPAGWADGRGISAGCRVTVGPP